MPEFDVEKAKLLQLELSSYVAISRLELSSLRYVAGLDVSYIKDKGIAVAVLLSYPQLEPIEHIVVVGEVNIPYTPGLLAFREAPLLLKACESLSLTPDLLVVDGHGLAHPRRFGIASHIGVVLDRPSIGVAKSILYGKVIDSNSEKLLLVGDFVAGIAITRGKKELYFSIGHKVDLNSLRALSRTLFKNHDLPEPTYQADRISKEVRAFAVKR